MHNAKYVIKRCMFQQKEPIFKKVESSENIYELPNSGQETKCVICFQP